MKGALGMVTQGVSSLEVDEMMVGERERGVEATWLCVQRLSASSVGTKFGSRLLRANRQDRSIS